MRLLGLAVLAWLSSTACTYIEAKGVQGDVSKPDFEFVSAQVLKPFCVRCHGNSGGVSFETYADALKAVVAGDPESSPMFVLMRDQEMPPRGPKPSADQVELVRRWIEQGAVEKAEPEDPVDPGDPDDPPPVQAGFVATCDAEPSVVTVRAPVRVEYRDMLACVNRDVERAQHYDAESYRYFYLHHVWNLGDQARFKQAKWGLKKAAAHINLTINPVHLTEVDDWGVVLRLNTYDLGLAPKEFDKLVLERFPYAVAFFDNRRFAGYEINIAQLTGSAQAYLRGDWFVNESMQPPLYYRLTDAPKTLRELEAKLFPHARYHGSYPDDLKIAGIRYSGVAHYHRIIHKRPIQYQINGLRVDSFYRITFDVGDLADKRKNFFAFPFGPEISHVFAGKPLDFLLTHKVFKHDATEVIWGSPSGAQFFWIGDAKGNRQDEVPINVADDRRNAAPHLGKVPYSIVPGVSCIRCHIGMNSYSATELLTHVEGTAGFTKTEVDELRYFSQSQASLDAEIGRYNRGFAAAMAHISTDPSMSDTNREPTFGAAKQFEDYLGIAELAEETHQTPAEMKSCLLHSPALAALLSLKSDDDVVSRDTVEQHFGTILKECNIGKQIVFKAVVKPPPVIVCRAKYSNASYRHVKFKIAGKLYELAPGKEVEIDYKGDQTLSGLVYWDAVSRRWYAGPTYSVKECVAYSLVWAGNQVVLR